MSQQGGHCGREEEKKDTCSSWEQMDRRSSLWHGDEGGTISGIRKRGISNVILFVCKAQRLLVGQLICLSLEPFFFFPYCDFLNWFWNVSLFDVLHFIFCMCLLLAWAPQVAVVAKNPPAIQETLRDTGSIPGSGRSPGGGHGNPLHYSCLENPMDRGAWRATVHEITESWI